MKNTSTPYNIASIVMLILTVSVGVFYCLIAVGAIDPFKESPTITPMPTHTHTPPPTNTPVPTWTPDYTATPTLTVIPSITPDPTEEFEEEEAIPPGEEPTSEGPPTGGDEPSTGGDEPSTGGDEPSTGGDEPPTGGDGPPAGGDGPPGTGDAPAPTQETLGDEGGEAGGEPENPAAADSDFPFTVQGEEPTFVPQYIYEAQGCNWQGIAGKVLGLNDEELTNNLLVHVWGEDIDTLVGVGTNPNYGLSGWEIQLGNEINGNVYSIQLLHEDTRQLSDVIKVQFPNTCDTNLAIVYFQQEKGF